LRNNLDSPFRVTRMSAYGLHPLIRCGLAAAPGCDRAAAAPAAPSPPGHQGATDDPVDTHPVDTHLAQFAEIVIFRLVRMDIS
jgi:hypothetical protein